MGLLGRVTASFPSCTSLQRCSSFSFLGCLALSQRQGTAGVMDRLLSHLTSPFFGCLLSHLVFSTHSSIIFSVKKPRASLTFIHSFCFMSSSYEFTPYVITPHQVFIYPIQSLRQAGLPGQQPHPSFCTTRTRVWTLDPTLWISFGVLALVGSAPSLPAHPSDIQSTTGRDPNRFVP